MIPPSDSTYMRSSQIGRGVNLPNFYSVHSLVKYLLKHVRVSQIGLKQRGMKDYGDERTKNHLGFQGFLVRTPVHSNFLTAFFPPGGPGRCGNQISIACVGGNVSMINRGSS